MIDELVVETHTAIRAHQSAQDASSDRPLNYFDVVNRISKDLTGRPPKAASSPDRSNRAVGLFYTPGLETLRFSLTRSRYAYLCWGTPSKRRLRSLLSSRLWKLLLLRASVIAVNDTVTQQEVGIATKRVARLIPYIVDTSFYSLEEPGEREDFVLVPGNNGRNEQTVMDIASKGIRVVRVTNEPRVRALYQQVTTSATLAYDLSWSDLRELYRKCACVFLPIAAPNHAAGQTAILEALASGARVITSEGRCAQALPPLSMLTRIEGSDIEPMSQTLQDHIARRSKLSAAELAAISFVRNQYSPDACAQGLAKCLIDASNSSK